jgi:adenylate cyclase
MIGYRFVAADKDTHFLRKSFSLYLAPAVVERMLSARRLPGLGGEKRKVTIYFSDIVGFSQLAEHLPPSDLVTLINHYLSAMVEIIESHGGFVDKYIGDAIVAVFGAPVEDAQHERSAVRTALACEARLAELNREGIPHLQGALLAQRIGLSSGEVLVGNIGSSRRFNYTVMGDAVNLASRLEAANKYYGTTVMASEATVVGAGLGFCWRELDTIRISGRAKTVKVFEPAADHNAAHLDINEARRAYAAGLACWRAGDFAAATKAFARASKFDRPSALFCERARRLSVGAPPANWEPVRVPGDK